MSILVDWSVNPHSLRIRLLLLGFRLTSSIYSKGRWAAVVFSPLFVLYRLYQGFVGCELHWRTKVGPRLRVFHGTGLIINPHTVIGSDCTLRHCTTLGARISSSDAPRLDNFVDVGCNVAVLGAIRIADGAKIGAGSVVTTDVPANAVARAARAQVFVHHE